MRLISEFALSQINDVVVVVNTESRVIVWNTAAERLYGIGADEAVGSRLEDCYKVIYADAEGASRARKVVLDEGLWRGEVIHQKRSGEEFPAFASVSAIHDDTGELSGFLGIIYDLTTVKNLQEQLHQSDQTLKLLTENVRDLVGLHDLQGRFRFVSRSFEIQLGYTNDQILGQSVEVVCHPADVEIVQQALNSAAQNLIDEAILSVRLRHRELGYLWYEVSIRRVAEPFQASINIISSWHDIARQVKTEGELRERNEVLRGLAQRLSRIEDSERKQIAERLHDGVGRNLSLININLSSLMTQADESMNSQSRAIIRQIDSLLAEISTFVRGVMDELHPSVLDEWGIADALQNYASRLHAQTRLKIEVDTTDLEQRPPVVIERGLYRIAQEALVNVVTHARASHAAVTLKSIVGGVQMVVQDDGIGFDVSAPGNPSGRGLEHMRERALALNGRLTITALRGKGTRLSVIVQYNEEN